MIRHESIRQLILKIIVLIFLTICIYRIGMSIGTDAAVEYQGAVLAVTDLIAV